MIFLIYYLCFTELGHWIFLGRCGLLSPLTLKVFAVTHSEVFFLAIGHSFHKLGRCSGKHSTDEKHKKDNLKQRPLPAAVLTYSIVCRRRSTSSVPTTCRTGRRATTSGGQTWRRSAWPTATRLCAMNSVSWWTQWRPTATPWVFLQGSSPTSPGSRRVFQNPQIPRPEFKTSEFSLRYCFSCVNNVLLRGHIFVFTAVLMSLVSPSEPHLSRLKTWAPLQRLCEKNWVGSTTRQSEVYSTTVWCCSHISTFHIECHGLHGSKKKRVAGRHSVKVCTFHTWLMCKNYHSTILMFFFYVNSHVFNTE